MFIFRKCLSTLTVLLSMLHSVHAQDYVFQSLSTSEGLSNASVNSVYKDSYGFLWIGTRAGLNRYNGHSFRQYFQDSQDSSSLSNDYVFDILQVSADSLLIASEKGVDIYRYSTDSFQKYPLPLSSDYAVFKLKRDSQNQIWAPSSEGLIRIVGDHVDIYQADSTDQNSLDHSYIKDVAFYEDKVFVSSYFSLNILDRQTGRFSNYKSDSTRIFHLPESPIYSLKLTSTGDMWFAIIQDDAIGNYFVRMDPKTLEFELFPQGEKGVGIFYAVLDMDETPEGDILFGTNGGGIYRYNEADDYFYNYAPNAKQAGTINDPDIWDLYWDELGTLWVSTDGGGLNWSHPVANRFTTIRNNPFDERSLAVNDIHNFTEVNGEVWIAMNGSGGLERTQTKNQFEPFTLNYDPSISLYDNTVYALASYEDYLFVGSYSGGISKLNTNTNRFEKHWINIDHKQEIPTNYTSDLMILGEDLFVASGNGLWSMDVITEEISKHQRIDTGFGFGDVVNSIAYDGSDKIWCGSSEGLYRFDLRSETIDSTGTVLDSIWINHVKFHEGQLWVSTQQGIYQLSGKQIFKRITSEDGLLSENISGMEIDDQGRLWITTNKGLNSYDPGSSQMQSYLAEDGLQGNQFNLGAIFQSSEGVIYAGGVNGYTSFRPSNIQTMTRKPRVTFDEYLILKSEREIRHSILEKAEINLAYDDDLFTINFASDQLIGASKTKYQYRIKQLNDAGWQHTDNALVFTDLKSGDYDLEVRASNYDGIWGDPYALSISVAPPIWASSWAYLTYALLIIGAIVYRDRKNKRDKQRLENIVAERTQEVREQSEKIKELDKVKTRFFSNISHEFRTPLTLIQGPIESILTRRVNQPELVQKSLSVAARNVSTLRNLIDEILEFNRMETGAIEVEYAPTPVNEYFEELAVNYENLAVEKQLLWKHQIEVASDLHLSLPIKNIEKVLHNLVSNAIKYTDEGGQVLLTVTYDNDQLDLSVKDEGKGIPSDEIEKVFDRFYQTQHGRHMSHSSGIGLAFVKEMAEILGAEINVTSEVGVGSTFTFSINAQRTLEKVTQKNAFKEEVERTPYPYPNNKVLITEDNDDMAEYIEQTLGDQYEIQRARHGKEALRLLESFEADLIISDIMMPVMDGMQLLNHIKSDEQLRLKSVIMLTAKTSKELKMEALSFGLDDYLTKPFSPDELEVRVKNLLNNQYERSEWLKKNQEEPTTVSQDPMIKELMEVIEQNLDNSSFGVLDLSSAASLSDRQLTRVVKKATGFTPAILIKEVRLARAKVYLEKKRFRSVAEVSYSIGMEKPSHFSKIFFERYGKRPSDYL